MIGDGKDIYPGSKIPFIVVKQKPILALSPEEFKKGEGKYITKNKKKGEIEYEFFGEYDAEYYWVRVIKPLMKVVRTFYGVLPEWGWNLTSAQLTKILGSLEKETEDEEDDE
jgi:DNA polymerase elongation subunit (family B)